MTLHNSSKIFGAQEEHIKVGKLQRIPKPALHPAIDSNQAAKDNLKVVKISDLDKGIIESIIQNRDRMVQAANLEQSKINNLLERLATDRGLDLKDWIFNDIHAGFVPRPKEAEKPQNVETKETEVKKEVV